MDIFEKAKAKRDYHKAEFHKWEAFLVTASELQGDTPTQKTASTERVLEDKAKRLETAIRKRSPRKPPKSGVIYDTAMAAIDYMREHGEGLATRQFVPIVKSKGIDVGGTNEVGTMSARLSQSMMLELRHGKWFILRNADEETADNPSKDTSAASDLNQTKEGTDGATLA